MTRNYIKLMIALFILAVIWNLIFPTKDDFKIVEPHPVDKPNYWLQYQTNVEPSPIIIYPLDDPSEAWHEADEKGDSDDPEIYNDVYEP